MSQNKKVIKGIRKRGGDSVKHGGYRPPPPPPDPPPPPSPKNEDKK